MDRTYPRHVHRRGGIYRVTMSDDDYAQAREEGWEDLPLASWPVPDVYQEWTPDTPVSVAGPLKRPRGRPRKAKE